MPLRVRRTSKIGIVSLRISAPRHANRGIDVAKLVGTAQRRHGRNDIMLATNRFPLEHPDRSQPSLLRAFEKRRGHLVGFVPARYSARLDTMKSEGRVAAA